MGGREGRVFEMLAINFGGRVREDTEFVELFFLPFCWDSWQVACLPIPTRITLSQFRDGDHFSKPPLLPDESS